MRKGEKEELPGVPPLSEEQQAGRHNGMTLMLDRCANILNAELVALLQGIRNIFRFGATTQVNNPVVWLYQGVAVLLIG